MKKRKYHANLNFPGVKFAICGKKLGWDFPNLWKIGVCVEFHTQIKIPLLFGGEEWKFIPGLFIVSAFYLMTY